MSVSIQYGIFFMAKERALKSFIILIGRSVGFPLLVLLLLNAFIGENSVWLSVPIGEGIAMLLSIGLRIFSKD